MSNFPRSTRLCIRVPLPPPLYKSFHVFCLLLHLQVVFQLSPHSLCTCNIFNVPFSFCQSAFRCNLLPPSSLCHLPFSSHVIILYVHPSSHSSLHFGLSSCLSVSLCVSFSQSKHLRFLFILFSCDQLLLSRLHHLQFAFPLFLSLLCLFHLLSLAFLSEFPPSFLSCLLLLFFKPVIQQFIFLHLSCSFCLVFPPLPPTRDYSLFIVCFCANTS